MLTLKEIDNYFWPGEHSERPSKTLHDSAAHPGVLSYVLLFGGANPRWGKDNIIFTKSSLEYLPAEIADPPADVPDVHGEAAKTPTTPTTTTSDSPETEKSEIDNPEEEQEEAQHQDKVQLPKHEATKAASSPRPPVAVFMQRNRHERRSFTFEGYFRVAKLQFLEPHTEDLARMLDQKWTVVNARTGYVKHRTRDAQSWQESFKLRWAAVKFEHDKGADRERGKLDIERMDDEDGEEEVEGGSGRGRGGAREKKGVNELLNELRLKDQDQDGDSKEKKQDDQKAEKGEGEGEG